MVILIFFVASAIAIFSMKTILWVLLQWGAKMAIPVALILSAVYVWSFFLVRSKGRFNISKKVLAWVWVIGFIELLFLGGLYHLTPQFFPSIVGDFFFGWIKWMVNSYGFWKMEVLEQPWFLLYLKSLLRMKPGKSFYM